MLTITNISVITVHMKVNGQPPSHIIKQDVRHITKHHLTVVKTNPRDTNYMTLQAQPILVIMIVFILLL